MDPELLRERVYEHFGWRSEAYPRYATFVDMELDSLGLAEVVLLVEETYQVALPTDVLTEVQGLADLIDLAHAASLRAPDRRV